MAVLTAVQAGNSGTVATLAAASVGGDKFDNPGDGRRFRVRNGSGSSITVTFTATQPAGCPAGTLHDLAVTVAAGVEKVLKLDPNRFNDGNGQVSVAYSSVTTVTVGVEI